MIIFCIKQSTMLYTQIILNKNGRLLRQNQVDLSTPLIQSDLFATGAFGLTPQKILLNVQSFFSFFPGHGVINSCGSVSTPFPFNSLSIRSCSFLTLSLSMAIQKSPTMAMKFPQVYLRLLHFAVQALSHIWDRSESIHAFCVP